MTSIFPLLAGALTLVNGPVTGLSVAPVAERTRVVIAVEGEVEYRDFTLEGPNRLVVDVFGARHQLPREDFMGIDRGGVLSIRTSQYVEDQVRVVLELAQHVDYRVETAPGQIRVFLENRAGAFEPWSSGTVPPDADRGAAADAPPLAAAPPGPVVQQQMIIERLDFQDTPIQEVLLVFSDICECSIVAGSTVTGSVTATVRNQPWDEALRSILRTNGFVAEETEAGIIEVFAMEDVTTREAGDVLLTQTYRVNYLTAAEVQGVVQPLLTERGDVGAAAGANAVVVTDIPRVHDAIRQILTDLDVQTPQVDIRAKIVFVSRTALEEFGITYDLKDSGGNQLNIVSPGATDADGDGILELPDEQVDIGTNVFSLGGNSVAALGNANNRVAGPSLTLLSSLLIGRHTLITFLDVLESLNLSDIVAEPYQRVVDNQAAEIVVGEDTPIRVIDASAGGGGGQAGGLPVAQVEMQETGIILRATPHVTAGDMILLELHAERSAPQLAESDAGFIFNRQSADTRVLVRDGQTVVIGGLTVTEQNEVRSGIPLLMDLPLIGDLFATTRASNTQRDLIFMVTPYIVRGPTD